MFGHQDEPKNHQDDDDADNDQQANTDNHDPGSAPVSPAITTPLGPHSSDDDTSSASVALPSPGAPIAPDHLIDIKQQALQQLTPLVGHLDQSPEEKFRTTMMMIQASDNQELIQTAYEAAQAITDEKARAQALLDIVNEINYFTQHQAK